MIEIRHTIGTAFGPRRNIAPEGRGVRVILAKHELALIVTHYERAAAQAAKAGAHRAAEACAWRAAALRRLGA